MWVADANGAHKVDEEELRQIEALVGGWKEEERNVLETFLTPSTEEPTPLPPEAPIGGDDASASGEADSAD